ncbi:pyrroloquinoline-quinone synthase PqqC [Streptomyces sp. NBC_00340]|uniref:pyrroloquinoline-quinone synthase PqqC n=1 Tax=Streptomyces sp. NBC_00340 TaxID=2975716 RepID=UPI0022550439|nr:pyrroloquinoline-quinone synthase PqqC [Streptomyces sp. NBC_00340]MCX5134917.1 pyrroloquinoline-quinone synthase PqqC [Streptomyces sp. NBC_00340]
MTTAPLRAAAEAAGAQELDDEPLSPTLFEAELRDLARSRYHDRHPFNLRMHRGELSPDELRTWVSNRFHYQRSIPVKDALILAKLPEPSMRRSWLRRIQDHDGLVDGEGGIERWLRLGEAVGLSRSQVVAGAHVLPGVRLAVDGYVNFCRLSPALEAVASSLTELCAPNIMMTRLETFPVHYPWIEEAGLAYFRSRVPQGSRDGAEALAWVIDWARTRSDQHKALSALAFKCDVLWSLLDSVEHGGTPEGAR